MGDARAAYTGRLERFDRHVVFLRPQAGDEAIVVIADDLQSKTPARFEWWLHALQKMRVDDATATVSPTRLDASRRVALGREGVCRPWIG